ncbi:MAG: hypothetical protein DWP95_11390 [Proteobacteria bacterium]|nr:MAG: hypothetical protein DWP95_11390 [Pseudomonadota bacterium]
MSTMYALDQQLALFKLSGQDATTFLQNQIINVFDSNNAQPHFTAICNAKGRILFSLLIWQQADTLSVAVDPTLANQFTTYITMRRFRMDVQINKTQDVVPVIADTSKGQVKDIKLATNTTYEPISPDAFWGIFMRSQLPWITQDSSEQFIPQHLSLDQHQLIEYQKGCYPGQEIIARLHFIGRNKKQLSVRQIDQTSHFKNGQKVTINDSQVQLCSPVVEIDGHLYAQIVENKSRD